IPGRCEASNYDVQLHIGESRDSPVRNCAPEVWSFGPSRNDGGAATLEPLLPHHILHKYQPDTASAWPIPADVVSRRHFFRPPHIADRLAPKGLRRWRYLAP